MDNQTPIFIKIEDYKDVLDILDLIKIKVNEAKKLIGQINSIKNQEDSELELWHNELIDIEKKVDYMDKSLFEPQNL